MEYTFDKNTFFANPKLEAQDTIKVEVGDSTKLNFEPLLKLERWGEVSFSIGVPISDISGSSYVRDKDKIIWSKTDYKATYYDKSDSYEFEFELSKKPLSNIVSFPFVSHGLKFIKQPVLPKELLDRGWSQPENTVNSYVFLHENKRNYLLGSKNYGSGKVFHFYRPKIIDSLGKETWGDSNINVKNGILSIIIPQNFLDTAIYPIIIDPTFGYTTAGAVGANVENVYVAGENSLSDSNATVSKLTASVRATTANKNYTGAIHNSSLALVTNGTTNEVTVTANGQAWKDLPYTTQPVLSSGTYHLGVHSASAGGSGFVYVDFGSDPFYGETTSTYPTIPDPINGPFISFLVSIYATYTLPSANKFLTLLGVGT